jgi:hypothetical protein
MMETNGAVHFVGFRIALGSPIHLPEKGIPAPENPAVSPLIKP